MAFYCGSHCKNFDKYTENRYGEHWCKAWGSWVKPDKIANYCKHFWFLVNKTCEMLNLKNKSEVIERSSKLKDAYILREVDTFDFANDYVNFAPIVCEMMSEDKNGEYIADYILNHCINPVIDLIENNDFETAYVVFENAFYGLLSYYGVEVNENSAVVLRK